MSKFSTHLIFNLLICAFFNVYLSLRDLSGHLTLEITILQCGNLGAVKVSVVLQVMSQNHGFADKFLKVSVLRGGKMCCRRSWQMGLLDSIIWPGTPFSTALDRGPQSYTHLLVYTRQVISLIH